MQIMNYMKGFAEFLGLRAKALHWFDFFLISFFKTKGYQFVLGRYFYMDQPVPYSRLPCAISALFNDRVLYQVSTDRLWPSSENGV